MKIFDRSKFKSFHEEKDQEKEDLRLYRLQMQVNRAIKAKKDLPITVVFDWLEGQPEKEEDWGVIIKSCNDAGWIVTRKLNWLGCDRLVIW